jgi:hypothetical protein
MPPLQARKLNKLDFTWGELRYPGHLPPEAAASLVLGLSVARENLGLPDGFFPQRPEHQLPAHCRYRRYQPEVVLCNAIHDWHPDHGWRAQLATDRFLWRVCG